MLTDVIISTRQYCGRNTWRTRVVKITDGHVFVLNKHKVWIEVGFTLGKPACILILETFVGPRPSRMHECCHRDDDRTNNDVSNLYWGTHDENMKDAARNGIIKGLNRVLDDTDIPEAVKLYEDGLTLREIATGFGVGYGAMRSLIRPHIIPRHGGSTTTLSKVDEQRVQDLRAKGYSRQTIADIVGTTHKVVYRITRR